MEALKDAEIRVLLRRCHFGHLGLADGGRAYVIPIFFGFDGESFYFHSQPGLKDAFIQNTKEACFVVDQVASEDDWSSVIASGPIAEVQDDRDRLRAMDALLAVPMPPEWGVTERGEPQRRDARRIYALKPKRMTGRRSRSAAMSPEEPGVGVGGA